MRGFSKSPANCGGPILAERVAKRQKELGLSNSELARRIGIPQQRVSELKNWPKYHLEPKAGRLGDYAWALQTSCEWLLGLTDNPAPVVLSDDEWRLLEAYRANSLDVLSLVLIKQTRESLGE